MVFVVLMITTKMKKYFVFTKYVTMALLYCNLPVLRIEKDKTQSSSSSLEQEYLRVHVVENVLKTLQSSFPKNRKKQYEIKNIWERFLLSSANELSSVDIKIASSVDVKIASLNDYVFGDWDLSHPLYIKMKSEFEEKKLFWGKVLNKKLYFIHNEIHTFLDIIKNSKLPVDNLSQLRSRRKGTIQYKDFSMTFLSERWNIFIQKKISLKDIALMAMRYKSILSTSPQWNVPRGVFENTVKMLNVSLEGFSSPINSQLMLISSKGRYGSLFKDTDEKFGSIGNLFLLSGEDVEGLTLFNNPPFIEPILNHLIEIQEKWLTNVECRILMFAPAWEDADFYIRSLSSSHLIYNRRLRREEYFYETTNDDGKVIRIIAHFDSHVFLFSSFLNEKKQNYDCLFE